MLGPRRQARSASRTRSPPRATRGSSRQGGIVVIEDLGSTNGTYLNEELLSGPAAAAPRRPRPHRRQRVHLLDALTSLMLRVAEHFGAPTPAASARATRTPTSRARRCSSSPTGWAARRPARSPRGIAVEVVRATACPTAGEPAEERLRRSSCEANARIHELSQLRRRAAGMGTTVTAAYVGEHERRDRPRRRQPRVPPARRRARAPDRGPLARRGAACARASSPREEADEHPQRSIITRALGPEPDVERRHVHLARRAPATSTCSAATA